MEWWGGIAEPTVHPVGAVRGVGTYQYRLRPLAIEYRQPGIKIITPLLHRAVCARYQRVTSMYQWISDQTLKYNTGNRRHFFVQLHPNPPDVLDDIGVTDLMKNGEIKRVW